MNWPGGAKPVGTDPTITTLAYLELEGCTKLELILEYGLKTGHGNVLTNPSLAFLSLP